MSSIYKLIAYTPLTKLPLIRNSYIKGMCNQRHCFSFLNEFFLLLPCANRYMIQGYFRPRYIYEVRIKFNNKYKTYNDIDNIYICKVTAGQLGLFVVLCINNTVFLN